MSRRRDAQETLLRVLAVVSLPLVLVGLGGYWLATQLSGCELAIDLGPHDLGLRPGPRGTVVVDPGPCTRVLGHELILRGPEGQVLWRALGPAAGTGGTLAPFTVGRPPAGYHDEVPLAFPLLPGKAYTVEVRALDSGGGTSGTTPGAASDLLFGGKGAFRPGDLAPGRVWFAGRSLTPAEFARQACATGTTTAG
ncbi:MAG TPA: hypothetical protein VKB57_01530 [Acidimicrobiales bacterium]|nr:hypothetical protein [Acidimicrobiales bacterium]